MLSNFGQSVETLDTFLNQAGTQLVDFLRTGLEGAYVGSLLLCSYNFTDVFGV